jgi:hypothetical protein
MIVRIALDSTAHALTAKVGRRAAVAIAPIGPDLFASGDARYVFIRSGGRISALHSDRVYGAPRLTRAP